MRITTKMELAIRSPSDLTAKKSDTLITRNRLLIVFKDHQ